MIGDQTGYIIGKHGGRHIRHKITSHPKRAKLFHQAQDLTHKHGGIAIFLSRWALSPLGPYANVAGGIVGMNRLRFTIWGAAGEAVWVLIYITLGLLFADQIIYAAEVASDLSGLLVALVLTFGFGHWLWKRWRDHHRHG
jgi:membrane protein DedA with SNARE-associated domain